MTQQDRLQAEIAQLVAAALAQQVQSGDALVYHTTWLYTVTTCHPGIPPTYDLKSTDPRMPDLQGAMVWPGTSGASAEAVQGSQVRVQFFNADRTRYGIVGLDPNAPNVVHVPANVSVQLAGGGQGVARVNDTVAIQSPITDSGGNTISPTQFAAGKPFISTGSAKVSSG